MLTAQNQIKMLSLKGASQVLKRFATHALYILDNFIDDPLQNTAEKLILNSVNPSRLLTLNQI